MRAEAGGPTLLSPPLPPGDDGADALVTELATPPVPPFPLPTKNKRILINCACAFVCGLHCLFMFTCVCAYMEARG